MKKVAAVLVTFLMLGLLGGCKSAGKSSGDYLAKYGAVGGYLIQGDSLLYEKEYSEAMAYYRKALERKPRCVDAYIGLGIAYRYHYQDSLAQAGEFFAKAYNLEPSYPRALYHYGYSLVPEMGMLPKNVPEEIMRDSAVYYMEKAVAEDDSLCTPYLLLWTVYISLNEYDKADEQVKALYDKEFFPPVMLDYAYNLMVGADSGAVVFSNGDMDTYPLLALQQGQGFRPDIRVVNLSLLNVKWYARYIRDWLGVPVVFSDKQIDSLPLYTFEDGNAVMLSDMLVDHIVQNAGDVPVYFLGTVSPSKVRSYSGYTIYEGFLYRLSDEPTDMQIDTARLLDNINNLYRMRLPDSFPLWSNNDSPITRDYTWIPVRYTVLYLEAVNMYLANDEYDSAKTCIRRAFDIAQSHCDEDVIDPVVNTWLIVEPDNPEALELRDR